MKPSTPTGLFEYVNGNLKAVHFDTLVAHAQRIAEARLPAVEFTSPERTEAYLWPLLSQKQSEVFSVLYLDNRHRLIQYREEFTGTINASAVYPREIIRNALKLNAAAIILAHNHPSGDPEPSQCDIKCTESIRKAADLLDIRVLDHVIVGAGHCVSLALRGHL